MRENFKKILVLVDFSTASIHAAEQAAVIGAKFNSELHLLHVSSNTSLSYLLRAEVYELFHAHGNEKDIFRKNKFRLEKLKIDLENRFSVNILTYEVSGSLKDKVSSYVYQCLIDLVVVGVKKNPGLREYILGSTAEMIIHTVNCEVLCIRQESSCRKLKKIIIPVAQFIPKRKISLAYVLARKFEAHVHLISLAASPDDLSNEHKKVLMGAWQYLNDNTNISVECNTITGSNLAEATLRYAKKTGADLILVNPGSESRLSTAVLNRWGADIVNHSPIAVLSVIPVMDRR